MPSTPTSPAPSTHRRSSASGISAPATSTSSSASTPTLSSRSQYQRFHGAKPRLSPRDLRFLAGADGHDHVALVALDRCGDPVAIARFVRLRDRPSTADIAAEVVDAAQSRGIGSGLVTRLARHAAAAGVTRFTATVLSETGLRRSLVRRGWTVASMDGPTTTLEVDVWALLSAAS